MSESGAPREATAAGEWRLLWLSAAAFVVFLSYLTLGLHFDLFRSDIASYWRQSFEWRSPFSTWWVPGYSLVIAALRGLTLGLLPPLAVMIPIAAVAYLVAVRAVYRIAVEAGAPAPFEAAILFAFFPLVGLTYSVYPMSDIAAIALFLMAVLEMRREHWGRFTLFASLAMIFHKVMWFFVPPLLVIAFLQYPRSRAVLPLAFVPLLAWALGGYFKFHHPLWFVRFNYETHTVAKEGLPVFGGLIQTFQAGAPAKLAKGIVIVAILLASLISAAMCARRRLWAGLSISLTVAFLVAAVNAYEIWIAIRYSRLLVVPAALLAVSSGRPIWRGRVAFGAVTVFLLLTNLAFGYYLAHYFD